MTSCRGQIGQHVLKTQTPTEICTLVILRLVMNYKKSKLTSNPLKYIIVFFSIKVDRPNPCFTRMRKHTILSEFHNSPPLTYTLPITRVRHLECILIFFLVLKSLTHVTITLLLPHFKLSDIQINTRTYVKELARLAIPREVLLSHVLNVLKR